MMMDLDESFVEATCSVQDNEEGGEEIFVIDIDYEFDAPKYYDFTKHESDSYVHDAEVWFLTGQGYPPSPRIVKLNWRPDFDVEEERSTSCSNSNDKGSKSKSKVKAKTKSAGTKVFNFMNPTTSQLAKQIQAHPLLLRRFNKLSETNEGRSSASSSIVGFDATKRQKLEAGYLRKISGLKHQPLSVHKPPKKVTVLRGPTLETGLRAERHRLKKNLECIERSKSDSRAIKIQKTPSQTECQAFRLRTSERGKPNAAVSISNSCSVTRKESVGTGRTNSIAALKERVDKFRTRVNKGLNLPINRRFQDDPSLLSFSKLSLAEAHSTSKSQPRWNRHSRETKENAPQVDVNR